MLRRCLGAMAFVLALGATPALAVEAAPSVAPCHGAGVLKAKSSRSGRKARCRDGSIDRGRRACRDRGGIRYWL